MNKKSFKILFLVILVMASAVLSGAAAPGQDSAGEPAKIRAPVNFAGGSLSGIVAGGDSVLISDVYNKVIWRINADDSVEQAAGQSGVSGLDGAPIGLYQDGTVETAYFMEPWAIVPFLDGYAVTDTEAHVVRFFDEEDVSTLAGSGNKGTRNGIGNSARFNRPTGLAAGDDGKLYVADTGNNMIRVVSKNGRVKTYAKDLVEPTGLCWADGALYVAETGRNRILRIENGKVSVVAGGGQKVDGYYLGDYVDGAAKTARFDHPQGIAVGEDGAIYVADTGNRAIRKIADGQVTTIAGGSLASGDSALETLVKPRGILVQEDSLLVTDLFTRSLVQIGLEPAA